MSEIIGVRFKDAGKVYYFNPDGQRLSVGELVVVETAHGVECGEISIANKELPDSEVIKPLKKILRKATDDDKRRYAERCKKQAEAMRICAQKIAERGLEMKLVEAEYTFDNSKLLFFFTAEGRVDFRDLVRDLAGVFRTRIELRQIGVRDEAKLLGGLGICGQPFCCSRFLGGFQPVSIKMAKEQGLSLNPVKISGVCGRLMCCLKYEQNAYEHLIKLTPKQGSLVQTAEGKGIVIDANLITGMLKVRLDKSPDVPAVMCHREDVTVLKKPRHNEDGKGEKTEKPDRTDKAANRPRGGKREADNRPEPAPKREPDNRREIDKLNNTEDDSI